MIQRIQTIFLALAAGASLGLLGLPFAQGKSTSEGSIFSDGLFNLNDNIGLLISFGLAGVVALLTIFLFKNRVLQMRLALLVILILVIGMGLATFLLMPQIDSVNNLNIKPGAIFPILGIIFALLAHRNIKKDENMVRSMDRLR